MNLITKFAYNALTKTIQAIAPGGVSVALASTATTGEQKTLTLTNPMGSGTLTTNRAVGFKYYSGGAWRLRFNLSFSYAGVSNNNYVAVTITGVTFKAGTQGHQAISFLRYNGISAPTGFGGGSVSPNTGQALASWVTVNADMNGEWRFSGDVECESEPTI